MCRRCDAPRPPFGIHYQILRIFANLLRICYLFGGHSIAPPSHGMYEFLYTRHTLRNFLTYSAVIGVELSGLSTQWDSCALRASKRTALRRAGGLSPQGSPVTGSVVWLARFTTCAFEGGASL